MTERNEDFDELMNEVFEPYQMGELTFYPADILAKCDPIAYRIELTDYEDRLEQEKMEETKVYQVEIVSGYEAEVIIETVGAGITITVKIGGKKLNESNLGPAEIEALKRFFTE
jgi:hypothetical protein